ncbi:NfeD family protein [Pseudactinotalea sp. Z1739]|uniref:NfeD family protein n=1 Tax=Pseudactinotalea sp. Z1739 TaxID=3413028 RepID=UPI003C7ADB45
MGWLWWLGVALVLGVIEMLTVDLLFLMLAGGATAAAISGAMGAPFWLQLIIAAVVSVGLLVLVRPWALAKLKANTPQARTNVDAHRGRIATVVSDVSDRAGRVKLTGEVWTARTEAPGAVLPVGARVSVVRIEGATAIVEPLPVETNPSQPYGPPGPGY